MDIIVVRIITKIRSFLLTILWTDKNISLSECEQSNLNFKMSRVDSSSVLILIYAFPKHKSGGNAQCMDQSVKWNEINVLEEFRNFRAQYDLYYSRKIRSVRNLDYLLIARHRHLLFFLFFFFRAEDGREEKEKSGWTVEWSENIAFQICRTFAKFDRSNVELNVA